MNMLFKLLLALAFFSAFLYSQQPPQENPLVKQIIPEISADSIKAAVTKLVSFGTRHTLSDTTSPTRGIGAARRWLKSEFERYAKTSEGRMFVEFHETIVEPSRRVPYPVNVVNIVATLRPGDASSPSAKRMILVSGHYDSRASDAMDSTSDAPGANDDGSGTAVVLELARVMSRYQFDATIVCICFAGEEQGLLGATAYAEMAKQRGWNIEAVFNNDIVGNTRGGSGKVESAYVRIFSEAYSQLDTGSVFQQRNSQGLENDGASRTLARYVNETARQYLPTFEAKMIYRRDRFLRGGDQTPFHQRGFAAIRLSEVNEHYAHQHQDVREEGGNRFGDLPDYMDFPYCANVARVNASGIASLALAPAPPSGVGIVTSGLAYDTQLRWSTNTEPDLAGYYVRYRQTTSPAWEHTVFTNDTTITLPVSKDDVIVAVQAVDKDGNASLPVVPKPVR